MEFYVYSILLGIAAWVYSMILLRDGMILGWLGKSLARLPDWLCDPLGGCEYCVAGQFALWFYLYVFWNSYLDNVIGNIVNHILFITATIFVVSIINTWKQSD